MSRLRIILVMGAAFAGAGSFSPGGGYDSGLRALQAQGATQLQRAAANFGQVASPQAAVKGVFGSGYYRRFKGWTYSKPWTCVAIEQRKARKRRNQLRHKQRR